MKNIYKYTLYEEKYIIDSSYYTAFKKAMKHIDTVFNDVFSCGSEFMEVRTDKKSYYFATDGKHCLDITRIEAH